MTPVDFQDPWLRGTIDIPYRFGPRSYGRIDAGESYLRLDTRLLNTGISTAAQVWGPARFHPLVLGRTAGGFPHGFLETAAPVPLGIGRVHARWVAGLIPSSSFGPAHAGTTRRVGIGAVGSFMPRGLDGVEIGATRFFHLYDSPAARDLQSLTLPFSGLLKARLRNPDTSQARSNNQLGSLFFRVAPPRAPVEAYGEFFREDHSVDMRDLLGEPDHISGYLFGIAARWTQSPLREQLFTLEVVNSRLSHLARVRGQTAPYTHSRIVEGHTLRGLALGTPTMPGGGTVFAHYLCRSATGSWSFLGGLSRAAQTIEGGTVNGTSSGYYFFGTGQEFYWRAQVVRWDVSIEPGFGVLPATNVRVAFRVTR